MKNELFIIILLISLSACHKEVLDEPAIQLEETSKVKTATYSNTVFAYTYDAQGRQLTCDNSDGVRRKYDYPIGSIKESVYKNGMLQYFYKNDLKKLQALTGINLSAWLEK